VIEGRMGKKNLALVSFLISILILLGSTLRAEPLFSICFPTHHRFKLAEEPQPEVRWYLIRLGQQKIGYLKETVEKVQEDGHWNFKSRSEAKMVFNRLGKKAELIFNSEYVESESGQLIRVISDQILSSQPMRIEAVVQKDKVLVKSTAGGRTFSRELPYSGELLGPEGIGRLTQKSLKNAGDRVEFKTLLAELAQVASGERILNNEEEMDFRGEKIKVKQVDEKYSNLAYVRRIWLDAEGNEIRSVEPSPFGDMVTELSTEQEVKAGMEGMNLNQDQYQLSLVKANIRLPQARQLERVVIKIKHTQLGVNWPEIENDYQRIIERDKDSLVLEIRKVDLGKETKAEKNISAHDLASYLKANAYIDPDNPKIKKVAQEVSGAEEDNFKKALKLRNWVTRNMTFDLGIVFAPASEIIKNRKATCAGYAALLASLLRAAGIPARYVMGLVYVNGIWGGHAWVEAWIEKRWVPLDAAVPSPGVADPARLAIAWSSLNEGLADSLSAAQQIFGQVEIKVLEYSFGGKNFKVEPDSSIYEVKNGVYHNPGLELSLTAPAGYVFTDLDKVWPDKTLLALKGPAGEVVRLSQESWSPADNFEQYLISLLRKEVKNGKIEYWKVWGKKRPVMIGPGKSTVALANGVDIFMVSVQGKNSDILLKTILNNLKNGLIIN